MAHRAMFAIGLARKAYLTAVKDGAMTEDRPLFFGNRAHQIPFHFDGILFFGKSQTPAQTADMRIDRNPWNAETISENDVGRLTSDAWKRHEIVQIAGHLSAELFDDDVAALFDVFRLVAKESRRLNEFLEFVQIRAGEIFGRGVAGKQRRSHHVDAFVGALRRQDGGDQQLQGPIVMQRAMGIRILFRQSA